MDAAPSRTECIAHLRELIDDVDVAMLTTRSAHGHLLSRPLQTQMTEFDGDIWFMTSRRSEKVAEMNANPEVNVAYGSRSKNTYVSISGRAVIRRDKARIDRMWSPAYAVFFPKGKDDPDITLVRIEVRSAEYWDGPGSLVGKALSFALTAVTGDPGTMGENATMVLRGRNRNQVTVDDEVRRMRGSPKRALRRAATAKQKVAAKKTSAARKTTKKAAARKSTKLPMKKAVGKAVKNARKTTKKAAPRKAVRKATPKSASRPVVRKPVATKTARKAVQATRKRAAVSKTAVSRTGRAARR